MVKKIYFYQTGVKKEKLETKRKTNKLKAQDKI